MECAFVNRFGLTEVQSVTEYLRSVVVESPLALPTEELAGEIGKWLGNAKNAHSVSLLVSHNSFFSTWEHRNTFVVRLLSSDAQ